MPDALAVKTSLNSFVPARATKVMRIADWTFASVMTLSCAWIVGNLVAGIPPTGPDAMDHMQWMTQYLTQLDSGVWYPRWLAQSFGGFGLPVFYIYPPLAYYTAWLFHLVLPWLAAEGLWRVISILCLIGSGWTGYLYFRRYAPDRNSALVASIAYVALPHRYWAVLVRCAYTESFVFLFLPLFFLALDQAIDDQFRGVGIIGKRIAVIAILTATILLTSAPIAAMLSLATPIYVLVRTWSERQVLKSIAAPLGLAALLGLALSAVWLLPALHYRPFVQTELAYDPGFARMYDILAIFLVNRSNLIFVPMVMGLIAFVTASILWIERRSLPTSTNGWLWIGLLVALLQLPISWPVWNWVYPLRVTQFSDRWGVLMCLVVPIAFLSVRRAKPRAVILAAIAALTVLSNVHAYSTLESSWTFVGYDNHHAPKMDAFEYLPKTVEKGGWPTHLLALKASVPEVAIDSGLARVSAVERRATHTGFTVVAQSPVVLTIARFYWPDWKLTENGRELAIQPTHNGFIQTHLDSGEYQLSLDLLSSSSETRGVWISGATAALLLGLGVFRIRRSQPLSLQSSGRYSSRNEF